MTRILKFLISVLYFFFIEIKHFISKLLRIKTKPRCVTLYYHSIYHEESNNFYKQMKLISKNFNVVKSDYFGELEKDKRHIIITFDDGFANLIENAISTLQKFDFPYTIFFITNYFGKKPGWEFPKEHRDRNEHIMSIEQLREINGDLLTIGSHTANHFKLSTLNDEKLRLELSESKQFLEEITGSEISLISFPNGDFNKNIIQKSFETGYKRVFTIEPNFSLQSINEKITGRIWVNGNDWYPEFWLKVYGGYCWLDSAFRLKRKYFSR